MTAPLFVALATRLHQIAEGSPHLAGANLKTHVLEMQSLAKFSRTALQSFQQQLKPRTDRNQESHYGDGFVANDLDDLLDEDYGQGYWLAEADLTSFLGVVSRHPESTMANLIELATTDPQIDSELLDSFRDLWPTREVRITLASPPWRQLLHELSAAGVCLGMARFAALASILRDGTAPDGRFSETERKLYLEAEPTTLRRTARAWFWIHDCVCDMTARNDRAEQLTRLWLLHPRSQPLSEYLPLLYRSYVAGHYPESIVLCRAILERAVKDAIPGKELPPPENMRDRLDLLVRLKALSSREKARAWHVWLRGNKVVHESPHVVQECLGTIQDTLAVIDSLQERESPLDAV